MGRNKAKREERWVEIRQGGRMIGRNQIKIKHMGRNKVRIKKDGQK